MKRNTVSDADAMSYEETEREAINHDLDVIDAMIGRATRQDDIVVIEQAVRRVRHRFVAFARLMDDETFARMMRPDNEHISGNVVRMQRRAR
jgi:hypothetical protein